LKGKDIEHACDQIFTSAKMPEVKKLLGKKLGFLIVCSRYPRFDSFVRRAKEESLKKFKAPLHVVCDKGEFDIRKVVRFDGP
jgi:hypothetical protein